jgi:hypothetical protein
MANANLPALSTGYATVILNTGNYTWNTTAF